MSNKPGFVGYPHALPVVPTRLEKEPLLSGGQGVVNEPPDEDIKEDQVEDLTPPTTTYGGYLLKETGKHPSVGIAKQDPGSLGEEPNAFDAEDNAGTHTISKR